MVGFTCMFDQTIASLALAKLVKEEFPDVFIVLGGCALEGITGEQIIKSFPFVDCVAFGAGEYIIEDLAKASVDRALLPQIPNICYRKPKEEKIYITERQDNFDMNDSPIPDYDDFVSDINKMKTQYGITISWDFIPIVTSHGCWWGEKNQCIFCGINHKAIKYRYKDSEVVLNEIKELQKKYNKPFFLLSDYILPYTYYDNLLPKLAELNQTIESPPILVVEIKANIKEEHMRLLSAAGMKEIQPGIESFSSNILKKMNKGVNAMQNIYCLMLAIKYKTHINYNILYSFPDDEITDYDQMLKTIPMLYHLDSPTVFSSVAITRDSPLQQEGEKYGLTSSHTHDSRYSILFSEDFLKKHDFDLDNYCYYFEKSFVPSKELNAFHLFLNTQVSYWQETQRKRRIELSYKTEEDGIVFTDSRIHETGKILRFDKKVLTVYKECECVIISQKELMSRLSGQYSEEEILSVLETLSQNRLIYRENDKILGLAFHESVYLSQPKFIPPPVEAQG